MVTRSQRKTDATSIIKLFHFNEINSEFLPNEFYSLRDYNLNIVGTTQKKLKNLMRDHESEFVFYAPRINYHQLNMTKTCYNRTQSCIKNNRFEFQKVIDINFNKLLLLFRKNDIKEILSLVHFYITSLYNSKTKEEIKEMFYNNIISSRIYMSTMTCLEIIEKSEISFWKAIETKNNIKNLNFYNSTEKFYKFGGETTRKMGTSKKDIEVFFENFSQLLSSIDSQIYSTEILKIQQLLEKITNK